mmetsp:Transcript_24585/g.57734  ORF Transcript_24585/g.57734 Transcript_24585/m.57734 type:complete len:371 (+) Transcript_24585:137-1249(+)
MSDEGKIESDEDRLNYLLDRGVKISTPEDREAARKAYASSVAPIFQQLSNASSSEDDSEDGSVKLVLIPHDESKAMSTVVLPASFLENHRGDVIPEFVKPYFAADKRSVDAALLQTQASKQFASGEGIKGADGKPVDMSRISTSAMNAVAAEGSVETFCLTHPADTNDYTGVYVYLDEVGMLKKLPVNRRAGAIGGTCGYHPAPIFYGDVFVGRTRTKPRMANVDFVAGIDTDGNAEWMRRAVSENLAWQQAMNEATGKSSKLKQVEQPAHAGTDGTVAQESNFSWTQDEEEIELTVPVSAKGVNKKELKVVYKPRVVTLSYQGETILNLNLFESVDVDGCAWTLNNDKTKVIITCEKANPNKIWPRIGS